jgi:hypothetical protein
MTENMITAYEARCDTESNGVKIESIYDNISFSAKQGNFFIVEYRFVSFDIQQILLKNGYYISIAKDGIGCDGLKISW